MSQEFRKTILVVCEGQRSEPDYFHNLRNEVLEKVSDIFIKILPIPKDEQEKIEKDAVGFIVRRGGKKREIKDAITVEPEEYIIEPEFKIQPTCYVRKAQLAYLEKGYSELWAVYDKDGHPDHENAVILSKDSNKCNKIVNIGFSSISFEQWILMHFEFDNTSYSKSQCRIGKTVLECGTDNHQNDCYGNACVVGRIVDKGYLKYNNSKNFNYNEYSGNVNHAFAKAIESRDLAHDKNNFYNNNPYVSLDKLVFKLKNIEQGDLVWIYENVIEIEPDVFIVIINKGDETSFLVVNNSNKCYIMLNDLIRLIDIDFTVLWSNTRYIMSPGEEKKLHTIINLTINDFKYAVFKLNEMEYNILDVIQIKNIT